MTTRIQLRRGTAAQWTDADPTLALGEAGIETDTLLWKVGDGVTVWSELPYMGSGDISLSNVTVSGNVAAGNVLSDHYYYANGTPIVFDYGNSNVTSLMANFGSNAVSTTGNITSGNVTTSGVVSAAGNIRGGNINTAGLVSAAGTVYANTITLAGTGTAVNASSGNILTNKVTGTQFAFLNGLYTATLTGSGATANYTLNLPANTGTNGQVLSSDGTGNLIWTTGGSSSNSFSAITMTDTPSGASDQIKYGTGNLVSYLDGGWVIGEYNGTDYGTEGVRISPGIEGNVEVNLPSNQTANVNPLSLNNYVGNVVVNTGNNHQWMFDNSGHLQMPSSSQIDFAYGYIGQDTSANALQVNGGGNVEIHTNEDGSIWTFDTTGNITLPSNTSSINYANGQPYGGSGSTSNLVNTVDSVVALDPYADLVFYYANAEVGSIGWDGGNDLFITSSDGNVEIDANSGAGTKSWIFDTNGSITFPDNTVQTTAYTGGGGANTGNWVFDANDATVNNLGYPQLFGGPNGGPEFTYLEEAGNNASYSQTMYINGEEGFHVSLANGTQQFNFGTSGTLTLPGNGTIVNQANTSLDPATPTASTIVITPDGNYNSQALVLDPTSPGHIHLRSPASGNIDLPFANIFLGGELSSFEVGASYGDAPNVFVHSNGNTWTFGTDGNLSLPSNTASINYANGQPYSGGPVNTGNVTFDDQIVIGTGDIYGGGGLYLSQGPDSVANLQYFRVRGGDYPTHIHFDTGNNDAYDQYFGDDNKFVKLELGSTGNVVIGTYSGDGYERWTFDSTGNTTVPGNIQSITTGYSFTSTVTGVDTTTAPGNVYITLTDNEFGGPVTGQVTITDIVGTTEANGTWYFEAAESNVIQLFYDRALENPVDGTGWNAYVSGGLAVAAGYSNISITGGNVSIVTNTGNIWTHTSLGQTIFPSLTVQRGDVTNGTISGYTLMGGDGNNEFIISTPDGDPAGASSSAQRIVINPGAGNVGTSGEGGDIYLWAGRGGEGGGSGGDIKIRGGQGMGTGGDGGYIRMEAGDGSNDAGGPGFIEITSGAGGNSQPGGWVRITGGQGSLGGGEANILGGFAYTGSGGHVNITGGAANEGLSVYGNVNITSGASTWRFDNTGKLTVPGEGVIRSNNDTIQLQSWDTANSTAYGLRVGTSGGLYLEQGSNPAWLTISPFDSNAQITGGSGTGGGAGKNITITAGAADLTDYYTTPGGNLNLQGGTGAGNDGGGGGPGGDVNITSGFSNDPAGRYGNVTVNTGISTTWNFDYTGNLSLPAGGSIYSNSSTPSGAPGNTITLQPAGAGVTTNQKLMIYPTAGDGDHIHMVTGNLYQTELFVGSDNFYVKLANTGDVVINSNDDAGNVAQWTLGSNSTLTLPTTNVDAQGSGSGESVKLTGARRLVGGLSQYYSYSAVLDPGGNATVAYTATSSDVQSVKVTFAVQSNGAFFNWEQFDVVAVRDQDNIGAVLYVVSNRVNGNYNVPDTAVTATINGGDLIEISLNLDAIQTSGGWSSFDAVEFGTMVD